MMKIFIASILAFVSTTTVLAQNSAYMLMKKNGAIVDYIKTANIDDITFENSISMVTDIRPKQGKPGTLVRITGKGFDADKNKTRVSINGADAEIKNLSSTTIQVVMPENIKGSYPIVVNTFNTTISGPEFEYNMTDEEVFSPRQAYRVVAPEILLTKNCYLFSLLANDSQYMDELEQVSFFQNLSVSRYNKLIEATDATTAMNAMRFSTSYINTWASRFADLWAEGNIWDVLVKKHLWPSGMYEIVKGSTARETLEAAFKQDAAMINKLIGVYGLKNAEAHCSDDIATTTDQELSSWINVLKNQVKESQNMFSLSLQTCQAILHANDLETTSVLYEPLDKVGNKVAAEAINKIDWSSYNYGVILCPGAGPNDYKTSLSDGSKTRCDYAINEYKAKRAPFIMVSGGKVHPAKTNYCEANEMKKYLRSKGIPESAILMEPQARHTPTNFRNCARIMFRSGMPVDKPCLVVCEHSSLVKFHDGTLQTRFNKELNYQAVTFGNELNNTCLEFYINPTSLSIYTDDLLDP